MSSTRRTFTGSPKQNKQINKIGK
uniref:Uncharacterized protein n=1 Tax=Rhizophora mucronata TaxID=61149 RepID=A0A2P2PPW7_RHIMU